MRQGCACSLFNSECAHADVGKWDSWELFDTSCVTQLELVSHKHESLFRDFAVQRIHLSMDIPGTTAIHTIVQVVLYNSS